MIQIPRWKMALIAFVCFIGFAYSLPNLLPAATLAKMQETLPGWMPTKTINLGLDLQGGAHLLIQADVSGVIKERSESLQDAVRDVLRDKDIEVTKRVIALDNGIRVTLKDPAKVSEARSVIRGLDNQLELLDQNAQIEATYSEATVAEIKRQTISQTIEIIRRRVDETGTKEPAIQRQGEDRILVQLPGIDDPQRIKELIGKTAKLTFHLVEIGTGGSSLTTKTLPYQEQPGTTLSIKRRADITGDMLTNAQTGFDGQSGQPVVNFQLDAIGTKRFCKVSSDNIGNRFAIVLDDEIISAPVFRGAICGGAAQISGSFTVQTANDLSLLLRAGALPADLTFIEERTVGPSLGADSIKAGKEASLIALALVLMFMLIFYRRLGVYASIALIANVALIFALLSMMQATLTLPGIAGIVLTIGMAVDANVLIFERIKEELGNGRSLLAAVDTGYSRAFGTIMDANLTTLIAAIILHSFGTGPIKGFAVTLAIGILTSLFTAIMVTRLLIVLWLRLKKPTVLKI